MENFRTTNEEMIVLQFNRTMRELREIEDEHHEDIAAEFFKDHGEFIDGFAGSLLD